MSTSLAERKMKIPFDTLMDIEAVASKCKTKFTNWEEFVDESLGLFVAWWNDPEIAEKMFHSMSPHFTKEMQEWVISQFSTPMDPKQFPTKEKYLQTKAKMENELKKDHLLVDLQVHLKVVLLMEVWCQDVATLLLLKENQRLL